MRRAVAEFVDPDADYYPVRKFPEARPCHGHEELIDFLIHYLDAYPDAEWAVRDLVEVGDDRVLARMDLRAGGRESGIRLEGAMYQCAWLRHGRLLRIEDHLTPKGALHALGLEGETLEAVGMRE